eukprot:TRINITY_DN35763_c0_g1_i1.p1 TRINITY_DN35763_c0_g1~~TRINITY_DN35763_c0_g1_i1.p1  ORF type:complete len:579 (-),score=134.53 TRINITY_DN35763_c0_g1_i1:1043-2779(-)
MASLKLHSPISSKHFDLSKAVIHDAAFPPPKAFSFTSDHRHLRNGQAAPSSMRAAKSAAFHLRIPGEGTLVFGDTSALRALICSKTENIPKNGLGEGVMSTAASGATKTVESGQSESSKAEGPCVSSAAIIGGGMSGLLTAIALRKLGIDAQVYERVEAPQHVTDGTLLTLWPNGMKALAAIDPAVALKICKTGSMSAKIITIDADGNETSSKRTEFVENYGQPLVNIRWTSLLKILRSFLPPDCIHTGYAFKGQLQEGEDEVSIVLEKEGANGKEEVNIKAPLVIGCDGIASPTRAAILGKANVEPRDNGRAIWRLIMADSEVGMSSPLMEKNCATVYFGPGKTFIINDPGEGYWYFAATSVDIPGEDTAYVSRNPQQCKDVVMKIFEDSPGILPFVKAFDAEKIIEMRIKDIPALDTWAKGRVVLIGDAAHAMPIALGQGGVQAFEDVLELSRQIYAHSSLDAALREFMEIRQPRIASVINRNTAGSSRLYTPPPPANKPKENGWEYMGLSKAAVDTASAGGAGQRKLYESGSESASEDESTDVRTPPPQLINIEDGWDALFNYSRLSQPLVSANR